jgi:RNA polymerase sigma factor (sigma-70 family)
MDFSGLYRRHAPDVFRFALYLSGNYAQAQDIAAETFSQAWVARDRIRVGTVKAYLLMIARHLYRDQMKTHAARWSPATENPSDWWPDSAADPESSAQHKQRLGAVLAALGQLPEQDRAALTMAGDRRTAVRADRRQLYRYMDFYRTYPRIVGTLSPQFRGMFPTRVSKETVGTLSPQSKELTRSAEQLGRHR